MRFSLAKDCKDVRENGHRSCTPVNATTRAIVRTWRNGDCPSDRKSAGSREDGQRLCITANAVFANTQCLDVFALM